MLSASRAEHGFPLVATEVAAHGWLNTMNLALSGALVVLLVAIASDEGKYPAPPVLFDTMGQLLLAGITVIVGAINAWIVLRRDKIAAAREVAQIAREAQQRQWLLDDRRAADEMADRTAERIRTELTREAERIAKDAWQRTDIITAKIDENTAISSRAFEVANNVNEKIAAVGAMRRGEAKPQRREEDVEKA